MSQGSDSTSLLIDLEPEDARVVAEAGPLLASSHSLNGYGGLPTSDDEELSDSKPEKKASLLASVSNLSNTILGAGMLGLPFALAALGLILGGGLMLLSAVAALFGLYLLTKAGEHVRGKVSFYSLAKITYPRLSLMIDTGVALKCFGVATSYLIVIGDLMPDSLRFFIDAIGLDIDPDSFLLTRQAWIAFFLVPAVVLALLKKLSSWPWVSYVALGTVFYIFGIAIYYFYVLPPATKPIPMASLNMNFFKALPVLVFSYTCHVNLPAIFNELHRDSNKTLLTSFLSIASSLVIYAVIGYYGALTFGLDIKSNILTSYPSISIPATFARVAISLHVLYSYRLQIHPCRASIANIIRHFKPAVSEHWLYHWVSTGFLCFLSFTIAFFVSDLGIVFALVGATGSTLITYILPGILYIGVKREENLSPTKFFAGVLAAAGFLIMFTCVGFILYAEFTK